MRAVVMIRELVASQGLPILASAANMNRAISNTIYSGETTFTKRASIKYEIKSAKEVDPSLTGLVFHRCGFVQRLIQIGNNIICIFDTNRDAYNFR